MTSSPEQGVEPPTISAPDLAIVELSRKLGSEIALSDWVLIDQEMIDDFARTTGDDQAIHLDPSAAREAGFGGTIAHGMLTVSLIPALARKSLPKIANRKMNINYGFDRIRFVRPVLSGSEVRARLVLNDIELRGSDRILVRYGASVEVEGAEEPAVLADWLTMIVLET
jgi:acyl dehydratase